MAMVAFAIMKDQIPFLYDRITGLFFGVPFIIFINCMLVWFFFKTTRQQRRVKSVEGKEKIYEYVDTWFTEPYRNDSDGYKGIFIFLFWAVVVIANVWIVSGVIFDIILLFGTQNS